MSKLKKILHILADVLTLGAHSQDLAKRKAMADLKFIDEKLGVRVSTRNGRRMIEIDGDVILKFNGNVAIDGNKSVVIQSGWRESDDYYKIELNPEAEIETVFSGMETGNVISVQNIGSGNDINISNHGECCQCLKSSEKVTSAPDTDASAPVRTTKGRRT